jgi:hypothetical protein
MLKKKFNILLLHNLILNNKLLLLFDINNLSLELKQLILSLKLILKKFNFKHLQNINTLNFLSGNYFYVFLNNNLNNLIFFKNINCIFFFNGNFLILNENLLNNINTITTLFLFV